MKPQNLHAHEDRLLDFVYGELPPLEARAVESHVEGCSRCSELLAGMRGVRSTMAQLPMEPAPDAGLESLLAYAQQAARNAAAGPAPKPTWWRRWLVPAMGVAAVTAFGVISVTVNQSMDLKQEVAAQSVAERAEQPAAPDPLPAAANALPPSAPQKIAPQAQLAQVPNSPPADEDATAGRVAGGTLGAAEGNALPQAATPAPPAPAAKVDRSWLEKEAARNKLAVPGSKGSRSDYSNAGASAAFGDAKDAPTGQDAEELAYNEPATGKKAKSNYEPDRRDAMTQSGAFRKSKPMLVGSAQGEAAPPKNVRPEPTPAPAPAELDAPSSADGLLAEGEAQMQQQAPAQGSLRIGGSRSRGTETASVKQAEATSSDDFDDTFATKAPAAKREQRASVPAGTSPPPPPPATAAAPMPSVSTTAPSTYRSSPTRDESVAQEKKQGTASSSAELGKQAEAALRSGDRVREAELLRQALAAGAAGKERLGLLNRLCDAEFAIGRRQAAFEACSLVLEEDPRSSAAQVARSRLRREGLEDSDAKAGSGSRGPLKAAPAEKRAMDAPAVAH